MPKTSFRKNSDSPNIRFVLLLLLSISLTAAYSADQAVQPLHKSSIIVQLQIKGVIGPATADYIERNLQKASDRQVQAVLITMDTPGGLDMSMRQIIKRIIASPIPSLKIRET